MQARGWLLAVLGGVAALWAALALTGRLPPAAGPVPGGTAVSAPAEAPLADIESAAARLQRRLGAGAARLDPPQRNPFRFGGEPAVGRGDAPVSATIAPLPRVDAVPLEPEASRVTLVGLAERTVEGQRVRTAVLSVDGELHYVVAGDRLKGRYEVVSVGSDAVELRGLADGTTRRLLQK